MLRWWASSWMIPLATCSSYARVGPGRSDARVARERWVEGRERARGKGVYLVSWGEWIKEEEGEVLGDPDLDGFESKEVAVPSERVVVRRGIPCARLDAGGILVRLFSMSIEVSGSTTEGWTGVGCGGQRSGTTLRCERRRRRKKDLLREPIRVGVFGNFSRTIQREVE